MSDRITDAHNQGQEDGQSGEYEPPHGVVEDLFTWSESGMKEIKEENIAYDKGWHHSRGEKSRYD